MTSPALISDLRVTLIQRWKADGVEKSESRDILLGELNTRWHNDDTLTITIRGMVVPTPAPDMSDPLIFGGSTVPKTKPWDRRDRCLPWCVEEA